MLPSSLSSPLLLTNHFSPSLQSFSSREHTFSSFDLLHKNQVLEKQVSESYIRREKQQKQCMHGGSKEEQQEKKDEIKTQRKKSAVFQEIKTWENRSMTY